MLLITLSTVPVLGSSNLIFLSLQVATSLLPSQFHEALSGRSGRSISVTTSAVPTFQINILLSEPTIDITMIIYFQLILLHHMLHTDGAESVVLCLMLNQFLRLQNFTCLLISLKRILSTQFLVNNKDV